MILVALLGSALAQQAPSVPEFDANTYRLPIDSETTLWADDAGRARSGTFSARAALHWMNGAVGIRYAGSSQEDQLLQDVFGLIIAGGGTYGPLRLGVRMPVYLVATSDFDDVGGAGLGDLDIDLKATLVDPRRFWAGLAVAGTLVTPTGTVNGPLGNGEVGWNVRVIGDKRFGDLLVALNVGVQGGREVDEGNLKLNDAAFFRLGGGYAITQAAGVSLDLAGQFGLADKAFAQPSTPLEILGGGWFRLTSSWVLRGGVGTGLTKAVGAPNLRVLLMLGYEPLRDGDRDYDGIVDADDACPTEPEDHDAYEDEDGCPEPTQVHLWVEDADGNPVLAATTVLSGRGDDVTGADELNEPLRAGRYRLHVEAPGFDALDADLKVPEGAPFEQVYVLAPSRGTLHLTAVDPKGRPLLAVSYLVGDLHQGTLEPDGIALSVPGGTHVIRAMADGYHPLVQEVEVGSGDSVHHVVTLSPIVVTIGTERIDLSETVYFETNEARIRVDSHALLDEVVQALNDHPEIRRVRIEGHTDNRGTTAFNRDLSERRAQAVIDYLTAHGIDPARLEGMGHGEARPVVRDDTDEAWARNRRVVFTIVERDAD